MSPSPPRSTQPPHVRTFQLDGASSAELARSVNLFRGDVNLTQNLFALPGRSDDGLGVSIAISYQSNVAREATTWNAEAPTGVLGLGWALPLTWIEAEHGGSPAPATRQYVFHDNGSPNQLHRQPLVPPLFTMSGGLAAGLGDGAAVPAAILGQFRAQGVALSTQAVVRGAGPWTIHDDARMTSFVVALEGGALVVSDGGELYQLQNFQFWKIVYYPAYERWVVVSEAGVCRSFGGRTADTTGGQATSLGGSIAWAVYWTDGAGRPAWSGPSPQISGQVQVARAWYLREVCDRFGSRIVHEYNARPRDARGIVPGVEQQVGVGGKAYTKAVYLDSITDPVGRTVRFVYAEKLWSAAADAPREYADPHRATPGNDAGPYQDRYETQYLASIEVRSAAGTRMYSFAFEYAPRPALGGAERAVVNVTGVTRGDTYKRLLTAVTQRDQDGVAAPPLRFTYDLGASSPGGQPGALLTVTQPQGGVARYTYEKQELPLCQRTLEAQRPAGVAAGAAPRVFHGTDYVVVCFYNQSSLQLSLQVYTWTGQWQAWAPSASAVIDTAGLTLSSLVVYAQADFLAVTFNRANGDLPVYVYQRDTARPAQWRAATIDGVATGQNQPSVVFPAQGTAVQVRAGRAFLVVAQVNPGTLAGRCDVLTWRWTTQAWTRTTSVPGYVWIAAGPEWYAVVGRDQRLTLAYLDGTLAWRQAGVATLPGLSTVDLASIRIVAGQALMVIANRTAGNAQQNTYQLFIAQWNADYGVTVTRHGPYTDWFGAGNAALTWTPTVVEDTLVAVNGNLLRRVGGSWSASSSLALTSPPANTAQRFAYGADAAIRVTAPGTSVGAATAQVVAYDPTSATPWTAPTAMFGALPPQATVRDNWPFAGDSDWLFIGPYGWHRGTATAWTQRVSQPATLDLSALLGGDTFNSESLVNQSPGFVAFTAERGGSPGARAVTLRNGGADRTSAFTGEKLYTATSGGAGGAGVSATGPALFAAFPADCANIDQAQSVFLHRYVGYAVDGPIAHHTVVKVEMDDGFGAVSPTTYDPDLATAAADASGTIVKFYTNAVLRGASSRANPAYGRVVHRYLNGAAEKTGDAFFDMLDGMLVATETYSASGALLESRRSTWVVLGQVASSPTVASAPLVQLRGGWVAQIYDEVTREGVSTGKYSKYVPAGLPAPVTGLPVSETSANVGGAGQSEQVVHTTRHGVQFYSSLWAIHALSDVAQVDVRHVDAGGVETLVSSTVRTYAGWPSDVGEGVATPAPAAGFALKSSSSSSFPFGTLSPGQTPAGWLLCARTTARTRYGQETAGVDALGTASTTIFDARAAMAVASIANAAPGECAYLGFQEYEDFSGWTLTNVTYDQTDACAGTRSAVLGEGGGAAVSVGLAPRRADRWFVGCRYRTMAGFTPDGSGIEARVELGGGPSTVVKHAWTATNGAWVYVTLPFAVSSVGNGAGGTTITARNTAARAVYLDAILVAPLTTAATLRTFDPDSRQVLAAMDAGGRISRTYYDRAYQPIASVGVGGLARELSVSFLSRRGSDVDRFEPGSPNAEITVHSASGGVLEGFRDGALWKKRWAPAVAGDWSQNNGALVHKLASASLLTWATRAKGTYAIYFEPQVTQPAAITVTAGDVQVRWSGAGWTAGQGSTTWARRGATNTIAAHWLLVVGDGVVAFFGDGQLLFGERVRPAGNLVTLGVEGVVRLRNLTGVQDVRVGVSYSDAGGRQRQVHQLRGDDSLVSMAVFDPLDRQLAITRSAPGSFGSGAAAPPLAYRPGFVDVKAFLAATAGTWEMTGDVADYYRGQVEGGIARSDDRGYPYSGVRYEASPRPVQLETSVPGKDHALDLTVAEAKRRTVQLAYRANPTAIGAMPAQQYAEARVTSPLKNVASRVRDRHGQQVAATITDASGTIVSHSVGVRTFAAPPSGPTATLVHRLPNALVAGPQPASPACQRTLVADGVQRVTSIADADSGTTHFIHDAAGNLRFVQPAMGASEQWYVFYRYDALGRQVAEGVVAGAWDPAALQLRAGDPRWPADNAAGVSVAVTTEYDGDGTAPTLIGMKSRSVAFNPAPSSLPAGGSVTVTEVFGYDTSGNVTSTAQTVSGAVSASGVIGYAYNALGEVVRVDLPAGCPLASLYYAYDDHGDVSAIGRTAGGSEFGSFQYSADRLPQRWAVADWKRTIEYTAQGWVRSMVTRATASNQSFALTFNYQADGAPSSREAKYAFTALAASHVDAFTYDAQRRLASATGSSDIQTAAYDPNGNLWSIRRGGKLSSFPCAPDTNRVQTASIDGATPGQITWNARGQLGGGLGRSFEYLQANGRTRAVLTSGARLALAYGGVHQRVVKQDVSSGRVSVYFMGSGDVPVASLVQGVWGVTVQSPMGPLAWVTDRTCYLLGDTTRSVWGVVADGALVGATAWTPFGAVVASHGDPAAAPYGFQGHEWDREVGLHNFAARLYDPALARFLAPDSQCQFPSPYVLANNSPLMLFDPTGELSVWGQVGIGAALAVLAVAGVALTVATAGASAPAMTAAGTALAGSLTSAQAGSLATGAGMAAAGASLTAGASASTGTLAVSAGMAAGAAAAAGGVALSSQVTVGVTTTASLTTAAAASVASSTMMGVAASGMDYTVRHGRDFTARGFGEAVGIGGATGLAGGLVGGAMTLGTTSLTVGMTGLRGIAAGAAVGAAKGALTGATKASLCTILTNAATHQSWHQSLLQNTLVGAAKGALMGAAKSGWTYREMVAKQAVARNVITDKTAFKIVTLPSAMKAAATSSAGRTSLLIAADVAMVGWMIWGVAEGEI